MPPHEVRAEWSDDDGLLALSLVTPITVPSLAAVLRDPGRVAGFGGSIWDRTVAAKAAILRRVTELSGAQLSRVDIRISGASVQRRRAGPMSHDTGTPGSRPPARPRGRASAPGTGAAGMERILKRETRSSRAAAAVIAAVLVIALCGYALLETAVRADRPAAMARGSARPRRSRSWRSRPGSRHSCSASSAPCW